MDPNKYILPPPIGTANDMYEAFPQGKGTTDFTLPGSTILSGDANSSSIRIPHNAASNVDISSGEPIGPGQSKVNGWGNYISSQLTGKPSGNTGFNNPAAPDSPAGAAALKALGDAPAWLAEYFGKAAIILVGLIFIAGGLYLFAKK